MRNNERLDNRRLTAEIVPTPLTGPFDEGLALSQFTIDDFHRRSYLGEMVRQMKNGKSDEIVEMVSHLLITTLIQYPPAHQPDIIIPIPDSVPDRLFSPIACLAELLAAHFNCAVGHDILSVRDDIVPQKSRSLEERRNDTQPRYDIRPDISLTGKSILLFDDIYASGQSINEAAELIRRSRPSHLAVLVLASFI